MDLGDEAAAAGRATIQGYVDAANDMLPQVKSAYENLAKAASSAMGYQMVYVPSSGTYVPQRGYASGTDNAAPGFALVGEEGPELVYFNGGEKVMDAAKTADFRSNAAPAVSAMLSPSAGSAPPVNVTFQIQGNATQETVQDLRAFADEIVDRVMDTIEGAEEDARRRAY